MVNSELVSGEHMHIIQEQISEGGNYAPKALLSTKFKQS
jgi:hypothetical protein